MVLSHRQGQKGARMQGLWPEINWTFPYSSPVPPLCRYFLIQSIKSNWATVSSSMASDLEIKKIRTERKYDPWSGIWILKFAGHGFKLCPHCLLAMRKSYHTASHVNPLGLCLFRCKLNKNNNITPQDCCKYEIRWWRCMQNCLYYA